MERSVSLHHDRLDIYHVTDFIHSTLLRSLKIFTIDLNVLSDSLHPIERKGTQVHLSIPLEIASRAMKSLSAVSNDYPLRQRLTWLKR
jgi:hypothetical protein